MLEGEGGRLGGREAEREAGRQAGSPYCKSILKPFR